MSMMTSAPVAAPPLAGPSRSGWVGTFKAWWMGLIRRRVENLAIRQLKAMSDRQLKDIGIVRSQIEFAVRGDLIRDRAVLRWF